MMAQIQVVALYLVVLNVLFVESWLSEKWKTPETPLFLTPYIKDGRLNEARERATVRPFVESVQSYAGYLTVNERYNSNMFFWFFESERNAKDDPTVIWLQGGPGSSSLFGLFNENGPYIIANNKTLLKRNQTWSLISNLIFIDNPVGSGYSFTENDSGYVTNESQVGKYLYETLVQLLILFPQLQQNDLFLTGESYAGKYIPALGHTIHLKNRQKPKVHVNLKGMMIGNGFTDPVHMMIYSDYLFQHGLIDVNMKGKFRKLELETVKMIKQHHWKKASKDLDSLVGDASSLYYKYTGLVGYYNYYNIHSGDWQNFEQDFVISDAFKTEIHVGNRNFSDGVTAYKKLYADEPKSVIKWVAELLENYRVLFYNGQLDVICAYPLTVNYLRNMKWPLQRAYRTAKRSVYKVNGEVAGYYKTVGKLTEVLIRNAGHLVPTDQPTWALQLLHDFTRNTFTSTSNEHIFVKKQPKILNKL